MKIARNPGFAALMLAFGLAGTHAALADNITVFGTGQSANGTVLASGASDSHYAIISAPAGVTIGAATTMTANPYWVSNSSKSAWVGPVADGSANEPSGSYDYRTTFTLTPNEIASTAQLSGLWTSDNQATIFLNGTNTGLTTGNTSYNALQAFSINSGFVSGLNNLDFIVLNTNSPNSISSPGGPTGLDVQISGTVASAATPEPSSFILLGTGVAGALTQVRRRFKA